MLLVRQWYASRHTTETSATTPQCPTSWAPVRSPSTEMCSLSTSRQETSSSPARYRFVYRALAVKSVLRADYIRTGGVLITCICCRTKSNWHFYQFRIRRYLNFQFQFPLFVYYYSTAEREWSNFRFRFVTCVNEA